MTKNYARLIDYTVVEIIPLPEEMALEDIFTPEIIGTFMQVPDNVIQGWKWQDGEWQQAKQPAPPTLEEIKSDLKACIDAAAETERLKYITPGSGQTMTYQEKVAQAVAYTKVYLAHMADSAGLRARRILRRVRRSRIWLSIPYSQQGWALMVIRCSKSPRQ